MADFTVLSAMSDSCLLPEFDAREAAAIASRLFALEGPLRPLHGERDLNFLVADARGKFVLKIANAGESRDMLECQHLVFERLERQRVFPRVATALESVNGRDIETVEDVGGQQHYCRALPYIEGRMWSSIETSSAELLRDIGSRLASLDRALQGFSHPGLTRPLLWNMEITGAALENYKPLLSDSDRALVEHFESGYRERVLPRATQLRRATIHNDANRENVVINDAASRVVSVIDFGDMLHTWLVLEPAIAATYAMHNQPDPLASAIALIAGYHRELALSETEIGVLFDLIGMRLCMSVCLCVYQQELQPDNHYLSIDVQQSRDLLLRLQPLTAAAASAAIMEACAESA